MYQPKYFVEYTFVYITHLRLYSWWMLKRPSHQSDRCYYIGSQPHFRASYSSQLSPIFLFLATKWLIYPYFRTWVFPPWKTLTHHFPDYSQFPNYYILKFLDNAHAIVSPFSVVCLPKSDVFIWNILFTTKNFLKEHSFPKKLDWTFLSLCPLIPHSIFRVLTAQ